MNLAKMNLNEHEKAILRKRWGLNADGTTNDSEPEYKGQSYTIFFPYKQESREFEPITVKGQVPSIGDRMTFRSLTHINMPGFDHKNDFRKWYVKEVYWSYNVQSTPKDQLLYDHTCRADVIVDYNRWGYWWWNLKLKYYYDPKNKLKQWFRNKFKK
jgi:hypothetical protein